MSTQSYNFTLNQGASLNLTITLKDGAGTPINLAGYAVRSQMRRNNAMPTKTDITCNITDATAGKFTMNLTPTQTMALKPAVYLYDVETEIGGVVRRILSGKITVTAEVTR